MTEQRKIIHREGFSGMLFMEKIAAADRREERGG